MEIVNTREVPGVAFLHLARLREDPRLLVEFVDTLEPGVPKHQKWVMMISTQIGCPVGCSFCDAGSLGYRGNLTAEEMLYQIRFIADANRKLSLSTHPKVKVHFARMGEPSLNPAVLDALRFIGRRLDAPGLIPSLSTVAPKSPVTQIFFEELIRIKNDQYPAGRFQLQFSIHSTSETKRREIVPVKKWDFEEIAAYGARFVKAGDRKITLNFALSKEAEFDAAAVAGVFARDKFAVKITPVNPTLTSDRKEQTHLWFEPPATINRFASELRNSGFHVIVSPSRPEEIAAASSCGQLWSETLTREAKISLSNRDREDSSYVTAENLEDKAKIWMRALEPYRRRNLSPQPGKAGLLVMDMQRLFLDPRSQAYLPPGRAVLPNVRRLVEAFRRAHRPVYFTFHAHEDPAKDGGLMTLWWRKVCLAGTPEAEISPILEPDLGKAFRKCRYNAFSNSLLEETLRKDGIEEIVAAGVASNLCVESTMRDAFDRGFKTFVVPDATAAHTEDLHMAALKNLAHGFSSILLLADVLQSLGTHREYQRESALAGVRP